MQSVLTRISAFPYVPLLKYFLGSLIHTTSAALKSVQIHIQQIRNNLVLTVPIFLNAALPAVIKCAPLLAKTGLPVNNIDGTFQFFKSFSIFSPKAHKVLFQPSCRVDPIFCEVFYRVRCKRNEYRISRFRV